MASQRGNLRLDGPGVTVTVSRSDCISGWGGEGGPGPVTVRPGRRPADDDSDAARHRDRRRPLFFGPSSTVIWNLATPDSDIDVYVVIEDHDIDVFVDIEYSNLDIDVTVFGIVITKKTSISMKRRYRRLQL